MQLTSVLPDAADAGYAFHHPNERASAGSASTTAFLSETSALFPNLLPDGSGAYSFASCTKEVSALTNQIIDHVSNGATAYFLTLTFHPWSGGKSHTPQAISNFALNYLKRCLVGRYLLEDTHWDHKYRPGYADQQALVPWFYGFVEKHNCGRSRVYRGARFHVHALVLAHTSHTEKLQALLTDRPILKSSAVSDNGFNVKTTPAITGSESSAFDFDGLLAKCPQDWPSQATHRANNWMSNESLFHKQIQSVDFKQVYELDGVAAYAMKTYHEYRDNMFIIAPIDKPAPQLATADSCNEQKIALSSCRSPESRRQQHRRHALRRLNNHRRFRLHGV